VNTFTRGGPTADGFAFLVKITAVAAAASAPFSFI